MNEIWNFYNFNFFFLPPLLKIGTRKTLAERDRERVERTCAFSKPAFPHAFRTLGSEFLNSPHIFIFWLFNPTPFSRCPTRRMVKALALRYSVWTPQRNLTFSERHDAWNRYIRLEEYGRSELTSSTSCYVYTYNFLCIYMSRVYKCIYIYMYMYIVA